MHIVRSSKNETQGVNKMVWTKVRKLDYPEEKKKVVVANCKKLGLFRFDKLFPKDEDEAYVLVDDEKSIAKITTQSEEMKLEAEGEIADEDVEALIADGAPLGDDAYECVYATLMDAVGEQAPKTTPKKRTRARGRARAEGGHVRHGDDHQLVRGHLEGGWTGGGPLGANRRRQI